MNINDIETTVSHGVLVSKKKMKLLKVLLYIMIDCGLIDCGLIVFLFPIIVFLSGLDNSTEMIFVMVSGLVMTVLFFLLFWVVAAPQKKLRKKVAAWLEDAVELKASVYRLDIISPEYKPNHVQIDFTYEGEVFHKISNPGNYIRGFDKTLAKYNYREITIWYSPKYDEVIVPKQKAGEPVQIYQ